MMIDWRHNRFWWHRVSGRSRYGWMVGGRRLASFTRFKYSGQWMLTVGPIMIGSWEK